MSEASSMWWNWLMPSERNHFGFNSEDRPPGATEVVLPDGFECPDRPDVIEVVVHSGETPLQTTIRGALSWLRGNAFNDGEFEETFEPYFNFLNRQLPPRAGDGRVAVLRALRSILNDFHGVVNHPNDDLWRVMWFRAGTEVASQLGFYGFNIVDEAQTENVIEETQADPGAHELANGYIDLHPHWKEIRQTANELADRILLESFDWVDADTNLLHLLRRTGNANPLNVRSVAELIAVLRAIAVFENEEAVRDDFHGEGQTVKQNFNRHVTQPALEAFLKMHDLQRPTPGMMNNRRSLAFQNAFVLFALEYTKLGMVALAAICESLTSKKERLN